MDVKVQKEVNDVTKGICIYTLIVSIILLIVTKSRMEMITGLIFGSIIAILNFRLLAISMEKAMNFSPNKAQIYTASRYLVRMFIITIVIFVSVKNQNIHVIGTVLGLISTQIVIFVRNLLISKTTRKGV